MNLKEALLSFDGVVDNEYLDQYVELVNNTISFSSAEYTEKHHVIPRSFYITDYSKSATNKDISLNDPRNRLVELTYSNHFYAHWLLYNCTTNKLKSSNAKAIIAMSGRSDILNLSKTVILQICNEIKRNSDFYWSHEDDAKLSELYLDNASIETMIEVLHRTPTAIKGRICVLQLSDRIWTSDEEAWLCLNYADLGKSACARHLGRSLDSVEHKVNKLQISTRNWTDEATEWLIANYAETPTAVCAEFLNRSIDSITNKAYNLNLAKATRWTTFEDTWLKENRPSNTWQYCSDYLGRSVGSIKQRAFFLGIPNDYRCIYSKSIRCVETGEIFTSICQACKKYGQGVKHTLQGRYKSTKGLHFEYCSGDT
jgi:hypothetical protein